MQSYYQKQAVAKLEQYKADLDKGIKAGDLIRASSGYKSCDGICKVISVDNDQTHKSLTFEVKRLMKPDGTIIKNSKSTWDVSAVFAQKVDPDSMFEEDLKQAELVRDHLRAAIR